MKKMSRVQRRNGVECKGVECKGESAKMSRVQRRNGEIFLFDIQTKR